MKRIEHDKVIGVYQNGKEGSIFCYNILKCEYAYLPLIDYYLDILMKNKTEQTPDANLQIYETVLKQIEENDLLYSYLNHTIPNFTIDKKRLFYC